MFKASIALVLLAFAALAYGWVSNNDAILYGSIVASALAGLALLVSTRSDRRSGGYAEAPPPSRPERPARPPRERKPERSDFPSTPARERRGSSPGRGSAGGRLGSDELTRQLEMPSDEEFFESAPEPVAPFRPRGRPKPPPAPAGAAWADQPEARRSEPDRYEPELDEVEEGPGRPASQPGGGAAAADDFRSRLAAVLGSTGEQETPATVETPRSRRQAPPPLEDLEEQEDYEPPPPRPVKRGRKKAPARLAAENAPAPEEAEAPEDLEPEWIRVEDVPKGPGITHSGGGFARSDTSGEMQSYRPRRPVPAPPIEEEEKSPPRRRRSGSAGEAKVRSVGAKKPSAAGKSRVTRVSASGNPSSRATKVPDPDAPAPRKRRSPKPKA